MQCANGLLVWKQSISPSSHALPKESLEGRRSVFQVEGRLKEKHQIKRLKKTCKFKTKYALKRVALVKKYSIPWDLSVLAR
jgi:uncharacterized protein involved in tolerance to divalent cations